MGVEPERTGNQLARRRLMYLTQGWPSVRGCVTRQSLANACAAYRSADLADHVSFASREELAVEKRVTSVGEQA